MSTVMPRSTTKPMKFVSPVKWIHNKYQNFVKTSNFKTHFAYRNDIKVISPFLKCIQVEYRPINQLFFS